eukprot:14122907-Alexandrium_andersonii.AAC.1
MMVDALRARIKARGDPFEVARRKKAESARAIVPQCREDGAFDVLRWQATIGPGPIYHRGVASQILHFSTRQRRRSGE